MLVDVLSVLALSAITLAAPAVRAPLDQGMKVRAVARGDFKEKDDKDKNCEEKDDKDRQGQGDLGDLG
ncbi:hypothetical protein BDZ89DRAFT_1132400 [Hymenopellis radicata]|nr:hypothetical protein BDZ89DRAFT_1132400 [Hymenopellis radicata]